MYRGYWLAFDEKGSWSLNNNSATNLIMFGVDNSLSSPTDNQKNDFLVLGEGPNFGINWSFASQEKKFSINFSKAIIIYSLFICRWKRNI